MDFDSEFNAKIHRIHNNLISALNVSPCETKTTAHITHRNRFTKRKRKSKQFSIELNFISILVLLYVLLSATKKITNSI